MAKKKLAPDKKFVPTAKELPLYRLYLKKGGTVADMAKAQGVREQEIYKVLAEAEDE
jgi:hypothetical protein